MTYLFPDHNGTRQIFAVDLPKNIPQNVPKNVLGEAKSESQLEHAIGEMLSHAFFPDNFYKNNVF